MKVKMLTAMAGMNFSYRRGQIVDVPDEQAEAWVRQCLAVEAAAAEALEQEVEGLRFENEKLRARVAELESAAQQNKAAKAPKNKGA